MLFCVTNWRQAGPRPQRRDRAARADGAGRPTAGAKSDVGAVVSSGSSMQKVAPRPLPPLSASIHPFCSSKRRCVLANARPISAKAVSTVVVLLDWAALPSGARSNPKAQRSRLIHSQVLGNHQLGNEREMIGSHPRERRAMDSQTHRLQGGIHENVIDRERG